MTNKEKRNAAPKPFEIHNQLLCRGDGKFYSKLHIKAASPFQKLCCSAFAGERPIPSCAYPLDAQQTGLEQYWVLEAPLVEAEKLSLVFHLDNNTESKLALYLTSEKIKWMSRINYRTQKEGCATIRDFEQDKFFDHYQIVFTHRFEKENEAVWRFYVKWIGQSDHAPSVTLFDRTGAPMDKTPLPFELQQGSPDEPLCENRAYYSLILEDGVNNFIIVASDEKARAAAAAPGADDAANGHTPCAAAEGHTPGTTACNPTPAASHVESGFASMCEERAAQLKTDTENALKSADEQPIYDQWFHNHKTSDAALALLRNAHLKTEPTFDILLVGAVSEAAIARTIDSLKQQTYAHWRIANAGETASGDPRALAPNALTFTNYQQIVDSCSNNFVMLVNSGDELDPDALYQYAKALQNVTEPCVLYCDEDTIADDARHVKPQFKTQLNVDLLYCFNCVGHALALDRRIIAHQGFDDISFTACDGYALVLHALTQNAAFYHVPHVLYHACAPEQATANDTASHERCKDALMSHFAAKGITCEVTDGAFTGNFRVKYHLPRPHPKVSIIIPSKDHIDVLEPCINSILDKATYDNYEIVIIENNSIEESTFAYYDAIRAKDNRVRVEYWPAEFNYSKIINFGASKSTGDYYLFLNNDTKIISEDFIEEMLGYLQRPDVGVVGPKLLFRDGLVQHSGMAIDPFGAVALVNQNLSVSKEGYQKRNVNAGNFVAVSGACQLVSARVFNEVGGYDEEFAVGFNDVDFCMRITEAGYRVVFTPHALVYHYEFTSRGRELVDKSKLIRWKKEHAHFIERWPVPFVDGDPFTSPHLQRSVIHHGLS